jgi:hypothetical protein
MSPPATEAVLAAGYATFLILVGLGLDRVARHSHHRSTRYRTAGFRFKPELDAWICPEGQHLPRVETDLDRRLARYRGKPRICNECPVKADCTDSDEGREIVRALDPWPHSEAGRFHRGISLALLALAGVIVAIALVRNHAPADLALLGILAGVILVAAVRMLDAFRHSPSFPAPPTPTGL